MTKLTTRLLTPISNDEGDMLAREGVTVIFTTHDPNLAAAMADYIVLMRQGAILAAGPTATTLTSEYLSLTYDLPVQVVNHQGRPLIVA